MRQTGGRGAHRDVAPLERCVDAALVVEALRKGGESVHCPGAVLPQVLFSIILHTPSSGQHPQTMAPSLQHRPASHGSAAAQVGRHAAKGWPGLSTVTASPEAW